VTDRGATVASTACSQRQPPAPAVRTLAILVVVALATSWCCRGSKTARICLFEAMEGDFCLESGSQGDCERRGYRLGAEKRPQFVVGKGCVAAGYSVRRGDSYMRPYASAPQSTEGRTCSVDAECSTGLRCLAYYGDQSRRLCLKPCTRHRDCGSGRRPQGFDQAFRACWTCSGAGTPVPLPEEQHCGPLRICDYEKECGRCHRGRKRQMSRLDTSSPGMRDRLAATCPDGGTMASQADAAR
jgi:hypothetical protein